MNKNRTGSTVVLLTHRRCSRCASAKVNQQAPSWNEAGRSTHRPEEGAKSVGSLLLSGCFSVRTNAFRGLRPVKSDDLLYLVKVESHGPASWLPSPMQLFIE